MALSRFNGYITDIDQNKKPGFVVNQWFAILAWLLRYLYAHT
jgi:hypothetical protein